MIAYLRKLKLAQIAATLFGVSLVAFFLVRLVPGDPVTLMIGERGASPEAIAELKARLGLDRSLVEQYLLFVWNAAQGNFGHSILSGRSVMEEFLERFAATAELGGLALMLATLVGIPLGILAALTRGRLFDRIAMSLAVTFYSMPIFWWGLMAIVVFSVKLAWLPVSGRIGVEYDVPLKSGLLLLDVWMAPEAWLEKWSAFKSVLHHLLLPSLVLATVPLAVIARMTRSSLLEVLGEDYIRTAKSKGLSPFRVVVVHALRNALIPVVTVLGLMLGTILTGAILTETIFSWPGLGRWLVSAVLSRDYPVIQGGILLVAVIVLGTSLFVDFLYGVISPRQKEETP
ncbi:MAG: ABC transporter permease [Bdellovibrionales bacterium]|jgi:dipeptide transport system permease protein|nr:ABC transporter permease [Bdellovibrionales bacterium]